ncbi:MAG TPA: hypothetical protein PK295_02200 [Candidatus Magasanikbacteria bacterium]|nr:hypothetical protein [Candidatus Magasanikbacteria bacterium]
MMKNNGIWAIDEWSTLRSPGTKGQNFENQAARATSGEAGYAGVYAPDLETEMVRLQQSQAAE